MGCYRFVDDVVQFRQVYFMDVSHAYNMWLLAVFFKLSMENIFPNPFRVNDLCILLRVGSILPFGSVANCILSCVKSVYFNRENPVDHFFSVLAFFL